MSETPRTDEIMREGAQNGISAIERELALVRSWAKSAWKRGHEMGMRANEQAAQAAYRARDEALAGAAHTNALLTQAMTDLEAKLAVAEAEVERRFGIGGELIGARRERDEARKDAGRLDYMLLHLSGTALWSVLGEMSDTSDLNEFRASIDSAMEKK